MAKRVDKRTPEQRRKAGRASKRRKPTRPAHRPRGGVLLARDQALADQLLRDLENGATLAAACKTAGIDSSTLYRFEALADDPTHPDHAAAVAFARRLARARIVGAEAMAERAIADADAAVDRDDTFRAKTAGDFRFRMAAARDPRRFGKHVDVSVQADVTKRVLVQFEDGSPQRRALEFLSSSPALPDAAEYAAGHRGDDLARVSRRRDADADASG